MAGGAGIIANRAPTAAAPFENKKGFNAFMSRPRARKLLDSLCIPVYLALRRFTNAMLGSRLVWGAPGRNRASMDATVPVRLRMHALAADCRSDAANFEGSRRYIGPAKSTPCCRIAGRQ